jgi:1,4-alpha-glucan branching enzyme
LVPRRPPIAEPVSLDEDLQRLLDGRHHDPFSVLGRHPAGRGRVTVRAFCPDVVALELATGAPLERIGQTDLFALTTNDSAVPDRYQLRLRRNDGSDALFWDPYCFPPQLRDDDLQAWNRGEHTRAQQFLGAHPACVDGVDGTLFAVWAPEAERVSVVGEFNRWDGRHHPLRVRGSSGVWEIFLPGVGAGTFYKFEIRHGASDALLLKSDPFARAGELRPATASVVAAPSVHVWQDDAWMRERAEHKWLEAPMSVYELHAGSWRRDAAGYPLNYADLADALIPYVQELGFTHVELMPLTEYPLDESWGYQPTGYFAPTRRYGTPDDLRCFVDKMHQAGIGVILDWVPGHFPTDAHGLARFDGSALFEYADPRKGSHPDWGTLVFNYSRNEVRSFLISSALYWLEEFHCDGLRVDAVASMLYLDYSREDGEWTPNIYGGNENLEAIDFLKQLNETTHRDAPGSLTFAEESTAWPGVTQPTYVGGLGFSLKWNMGWMHDTLAYLSEDPVHRRYHHDRLSFGPVYAFSENFILPLSHDEVVHGKGSLLGKMPGDDWQRFANLRLLFLFQWAYPGKKLLFMGQELAQPWEWQHQGQLGWQLLDEPAHRGVYRLIADLNAVYRARPALHHTDFHGDGFRWLRWDDSDNSVLTFLRIGGGETVIVALNFTPVPRPDYRIGAPQTGQYQEVLNSDRDVYGGTGQFDNSSLQAEAVAWMDQPASVSVDLPPLGGVVLARIPD